MLRTLIQKRVYGRKIFQKFFHRLLCTSLAGLNIVGGGRSPRETGEAWAIRHIYEKMRRAPMRVFDVGAQGGDYISILLEEMGSGVLIDAFEPNSDSLINLKTQFSKHQNVKLHELALDEKTGTATLYTPRGLSGLDSLHERHNNVPGKFEPIKVVRTASIDEFCKERAIEKIDLIKLDIEGSELSCLKGAFQMIAADRISYIQFEFASPAMDARYYFKDIFDLLSPKYRIYRILMDGLEEIPKATPIQEFLFTTNYLAVHRDLPYG